METLKVVQRCQAYFSARSARSQAPALIVPTLRAHRYTQVSLIWKSPSFRHGCRNPASKDGNLPTGADAKSSTYGTISYRPWPGYRHPCRHDGIFGLAGLVYNDGCRSVGTIYNADMLQPGGLPAISRGLSEATPPDNAEKDPRPRRGRRNRPMNPCGLAKTPQIPVQTGGILARTGKTATPPGSKFYSVCHPGVSLRSTPG
jgi:hypothetical protein